MRKLIICLLIFLGACSSTPQQNDGDIVATTLPAKTISESASMNDSPITAMNIDDYLFRDDSIYIDTREVNQFMEEGHIAGFTNIPFYEALVALKPTDNILFTMKKTRDENGNVVAELGDVGSFNANYEESLSIIRSLFPRDKNILIISTAGVESHYLINLLLQLGYDGSKLYNVGCFSNNAGQQVAYRNQKSAAYYVEGHNIYTYDYQINFGELTKIDNE